MKRFICLVFCLLLVVSFLESSYVGRVYFNQQPGEQHRQAFRVPKSFSDSWILRQRKTGKADKLQTAEKEQSAAFEVQLALLNAYFESEEQKGNLLVRLVQDDPEAMMEHHRYTQYYKGLEVFGGEIIRHFKEGQLVGINGEYYEIEDFDTTPLIAKDAAVGLFEADLGRFNLIENSEKSKLIIYPVKDGDYRLAYRIILSGGPGYSMTGLVDAKTGAVLLKYSNINTEDLTVGVGYGQHGERYKFPTTFQDNKYWLMDLMRARPVNQRTFDWRTYNGQNYYVASDGDNSWDYDGALVNAHTFLGLTYDYYYLYFGRKGMDNNNFKIDAIVHYYDTINKYDNAFWNGKEMRFLDPGPNQWQTAAALDIVAHEYSHGVTQFTSGLQYFCTQQFQPGALNESFSDIMGTAVEFYWQERGNGFNKADWVIGEDMYQYYDANNYLRSLSNPNSRRWQDLPYPCHLSQCFFSPNTEAGDWGGVHFTTTLYSHAYYLLSEGGTNSVSKKSVTGIGIDKSTKIFYRAFTHYMIPICDFWYAAQALVQSAVDIYGSGSNESTQTLKAMQAIGW